jgi:predicted anti-sigma-YlaC factor YlaD
MLSCARIVELITGYLEAALDSDEQLAFEEHVAICPPCRGYLSQMRATVRMTGRVAVEEESLPDEVREAFLDAFRSWEHGRSGEAPGP